MIGLADRESAQEVGIDPVFLGASAQVWTGTDASDAHLAHVTLDGFAIDDQRVVAGQHDLDAARAIRWMRRVNLINRVLDGDLFGRRRDRLIVQAAATEREQIGLVGE